MLGNEYFYNASTRKYIVAMGRIFRDVYIKHTDPYSSNNTYTILVPVTFESKDKFYRDYIQKNLLKKVEVTLPRISFMLVGLAPDIERKTNQMLKYKFVDGADSDKVKTMYNPTPWDFTFSAALWARHYDDALQVIEQVVPFFQPHFNIVVQDLPDLNVSRSIPIELTDVSPDIQNELDSAGGSVRVIQWTFSFTLRGWIYMPIKSGGIIKKATVDIHDNAGMLTPEKIVKVVSQVDPYDADFEDEWTALTTVMDPYTY